MIYFVEFRPNCEERYFLYCSFDKIKCEKFLKKYIKEYPRRKIDLSIISFIIDQELDYE